MPERDWHVRTPLADDQAQWTTLRAQLWPDRAHGPEALMDADDGHDHSAWLAFDRAGEVIGLAEASVRREHIHGTSGAPVGFLEGWYVVPAWRRQGVGADLLRLAQAWARGRGCTEFASDPGGANPVAQAVHLACGFRQTEQMEYFLKRL